MATLASDLDPVSTGEKLAYGGHTVCAELSKKGKSEGCSCVATLPRNSLNVKEICKSINTLDFLLRL